MYGGFGLQVINNRVVTSSRNVADGFEKKHKNVLQTIENLECSEDFRWLNFQPGSYKDAQNQERPEYLITRDGFSFLAMGFTGEKAARFKETYIRAFNEMESRLNSPFGQFHSIIPTNMVEALTLAANLEEQRVQAVQERDEAIRTKALIGSRREATAMATASAASKTLNKVLDALGSGKNWKQVRAISWLKNYFNLKRPGAYSVIGKALKKFSLENGYEVRTVDDTKYGKVCSFESDAIEAFRGYLNANAEVLANFRIRLVA